MYVYALIIFSYFLGVVEMPLGPPENPSFPGNVLGASTEQKGVIFGVCSQPPRGGGDTPFSYFSIFFVLHFFRRREISENMFLQNMIFRFSLFTFSQMSVFGFVLASVATRTSQGTLLRRVVPTRSRHAARTGPVSHPHAASLTWDVHPEFLHD